MPPTDEDLAWFRSTFHPTPRPALPDDTVEYTLHILSSPPPSDLKPRLREIQKYASELQKQHVKNYVWQRQPFALALANLDGEVGVSVLQGRTEYGDSLEDEWVITWLLRELSKKFADLWIQVKDNDGEFLLIEASGTLPQWLEPEVAGNRVWINNGGLVIVKPAGAARSSRRTEETLSLTEAKEVILKDPKRLMRSRIVEEEAFYRLRDYPQKIPENMHHAVATIPRKVAFLLSQKAAYIAPATEAFYLRDPIALKPLQNARDDSDLTFPPDDLVDISVRFPRVGYAQLKSQDFPAPGVWKKTLSSKAGGTPSVRAELGMKVSCGFEMLLSDPHHQDKPAVREMKMLLEDVESGDETLPTNEDIKTWSMLEDDEKWMDIDFDDLDAELSGKNHGSRGAGTESRTRGKTDFGDKGAQENLQRIVKQFEEFMNDDQAGVDGAGFFDEDSDDTEEVDDDEEGSDGDEDKEASFDEDEFTKMMREMMGMPAGVMREIMEGKGGAGKGTAEPDEKAAPKGPTVEIDSDDEDDDDSLDEQEMQQLMQRMEAELKENGALDLGSGPTASGSTRRAVTGKQPAEDLDADSDDAEDADSDIDINLVRNLLESFKSQAGGAGPGGNLMGLMGLALPRDEGERGASGKEKGKRSSAGNKS